MNSPVAPRNYHSVSLLLGDGNVMAAGGGLCYTAAGAPDTPQYWQYDASGQHPDAEIWSPPYLFNSDGSAATRPKINAFTTTSDTANGNWVRAGGSLTVTLDSDKPMTFAVIRMGSAAHSINSDQRRLSLSAKQTSGTARWTVSLPSDGGVLLPGHWFVFVMNEQGMPSLGRVVQVRV
jgi:galactose oxidase